MRDQLIPWLLMLGGEVVLGLVILVILDVVRGRKIRLEKVPTRDGRIQSRPRRRVAEATINSLRFTSYGRLSRSLTAGRSIQGPWQSFPLFAQAFFSFAP
jgi:hypothetical protein